MGDEPPPRAGGGLGLLGARVKYARQLRAPTDGSRRRLA
jgi:hypothetical protein